jgi:hypothetical protein
LVAIKDRSFDLFIQDDKKILFILEFRSITQPSTNNRLHGDGKVNTGVTTKLSKIKSCNRIVKAYGKNNIYRHS